MASNDFFMRQIEGMTEVLAELLFGHTAEPEDAIYESQHSEELHELLIDLRLLLNLGQVNEAENLLFRRLEAGDAARFRDIAGQFYDWLDEMDDALLVERGFSREEVAEGRAQALALCEK